MVGYQHARALVYNHILTQALDCFSSLPPTGKCRSFMIARLQLARAQSEEEVPLIEVTLPCLEKVQVYQDQFEWGGILETCIHQCPSPDRADDGNSCVAFIHWKREEK